MKKQNAFISFLKRFWYLVLIFVVLMCSYLWVEHSSNTRFETEYYDLYLPTDSLPNSELESYLSPVLKHVWTFNLSNKTLESRVKKGLYLIPKHATNPEIRNILKSPSPESIQMMVGNIRFRYNMVSTLCKHLDIRSRAVRRELSDESFIQSLDTSFTKQNVYGIFFQDSLWIHRHASARDVIRTAHRNWKTYWTAERKSLAQHQGLSPIEVMVLASIVQSESQDLEELPIIAGLYLNRLNDEMKLQADPTVVYSWGKSLRRILKKHLRIKSKYNTYRHKGLPPGPVFTPSVASIEAVLNPAEHDYFYFVANPELDGRHDFSETYQEHLDKAKAYRTILNQKKIYR